MVVIYSNAPKGKHTISNIYFDPAEQQVHFTYIIRGKLVTVSSVKLDPFPTSIPPSGKYKVKNLYVDPATGKLSVEYENTPAT